MARSHDTRAAELTGSPSSRYRSNKQCSSGRLRHATRWVKKIEPKGKFKTMLAVRDWGQLHGIDCGGADTPVCRIGSQRLFLTVAADRNGDVIHMEADKRAPWYLLGQTTFELSTRQDNLPSTGSVTQITERILKGGVHAQGACSF